MCYNQDHLLESFRVFFEGVITFFVVIIAGWNTGHVIFIDVWEQKFVEL